MNDPEIAVIILAAGGSSRMGRPKQLLQINEQSLLKRAVVTAITSVAGRSIVVLGSDTDEIIKEIIDTQVDVAINSKWTRGIGSSLKKGLEYAQMKYTSLKAVIVMVCDQPYVNSAYLNKLIEQYKGSGSLIIASRYAGSPGVPALFDRNLFSTLMALPDEQGAKKVILDNSDKVEYVDFPDGAIDLDTPNEWSTFLATDRSRYQSPPHGPDL